MKLYLGMYGIYVACVKPSLPTATAGLCGDCWGFLARRCMLNNPYKESYGDGIEFSMSSPNFVSYFLHFESNSEKI